MGLSLRNYSHRRATTPAPHPLLVPKHKGGEASGERICGGYSHKARVL